MPAMTGARIKVLKNVVRDLVAEDAKIRGEAAAAFDAVKTAKRAMSAEEKTADDTRKDRIRAIGLELLEYDEQIKSEEVLAESRRATAHAMDTGRVEVGAEGWESAPNRGYATPKLFLLDVMAAGNGARPDPRVASLWNGKGPIGATAGSDEQSVINDPYGGFLVPRVHVDPNLYKTAVEANPFLPHVKRVDMAGCDVLEINARVDRDHTTSVSGGLVVYRRVETQVVTPSRMKFEQVELRASMLMGVTFATEELIAKSPHSFVSLISDGFGDEFASKIFQEMLTGNGVGRMLGFAASPALITVAKESGQAASTLVYANLVQMISRVYRYSESVWYANHGILPALAAVTLPGGLTPLITNPAGVMTLLGRPIYFGEYAPALGTAGALMLVNPHEYLYGETESMQSASSIHVRFLEHEQTFKFWMTNAGAPWWRTAMTPKNGPTISPYVYLAA